MRGRPWLLASVAAAAVVIMVATVAWFEPWRLVTDRAVDEAVPQVGATGKAEARPGRDRSAEPDAPEEPGQPVAPVVLLAGKLISHEHETSGTVRVLDLGDGTRILRLEDLSTSDGPDVHVWLSDAAVEDSTAGWLVFDDGDYHDLGEIKGNQGNQNYVLPGSLDLNRFGSLSLWCDRFNVSFGAAALT